MNIKKIVSVALSSLLVALGGLVGFSAPASAASPGDGLSMEVTKTESGTGGSRVITWTVTITDAQNRTFITTGSPSATQILISRSSSRACTSAPTNFSSNHLNSGDCTSYFSRALTDVSRHTIGSSTITFDLKSTDVLGYTLADYETALASTKPFGAVVAYLKFNDNTGATCQAGPDLCWNLYGSTTDNWVPGEGAVAVASETLMPSAKIPSVSQFSAGYLLVSAGSNAVITGSRLNCTSSVSVNDKTTSFAFQALSDGQGQLTIAMPSNLAPGRHKLTMDSCGGTVVYDNILMVSKPEAKLELTMTTAIERGLALVKLREFVRENRSDYNTVECVADAANPTQKKHATQLVDRFCKRAFSLLASPKEHSTLLKSDNQQNSIKLTVILSNR